jgi:hypothetical protein
LPEKNDLQEQSTFVTSAQCYRPLREQRTLIPASNIYRQLREQRFLIPASNICLTLREQRLRCKPHAMVRSETTGQAWGMRIKQMSCGSSERSNVFSTIIFDFAGIK